MTQINGVAKRYDGLPIDYVLIFNWSNGKCIAQVKPDAQGNWSYNYSVDLNIGVTYVADGCEPITHGAYTFVATGYKFWRLANIKESFYSWYIAVAEVIFYNGLNDEIVVNPDNAISKSEYNNDTKYAARSAFDHNPSTFACSAECDERWWIGASFSTPVIVKSIGIRGRNELPAGLYREWQTADVEVSDDGLTWVKLGTISPNTPPEDSSLIISPVVFV